MYTPSTCMCISLVCTVNTCYQYCKISLKCVYVVNVPSIHVGAILVGTEHVC